MATPAEIQAAMDAVPRPMSWPPWWAISTLRPSQPLKPSQPPQEPVGGAVVASGRYSRVCCAECSAAIPEASTDAERLAGISMRLDISVWRLPYVWRLLVSFVARPASINKPAAMSSSPRRTPLESQAPAMTPAHSIRMSSRP